MRCECCGSNDSRLGEWWAPDEMWLHVRGKYEGVLCAACFDALAKNKGWFLRWIPTPYPNHPTPLNTDVVLNSDYDKFIQAFGRSMVLRSLQAEEHVQILLKERTVLEQEVAELRRKLKGEP